MNLAKPVVAIVLVCLAGCATAPETVDSIDFYEMDSSALKRIRGMNFLPPFMGGFGNYIDLGPVEGSYCQKDTVKNSEESVLNLLFGAHDQVKMRAAILGADAISFPICKSVTADKKPKGCSAQFFCRSNAFKKGGAII